MSWKIILTWAQMMKQMERARRKMVDTMTSTERWGPLLCVKKQTKSSEWNQGGTILQRRLAAPYW